MKEQVIFLSDEIDEIEEKTSTILSFEKEVCAMIKSYFVEKEQEEKLRRRGTEWRKRSR